MMSKTQDITLNVIKMIIAVVGLVLSFIIVIRWDSANENVQDIYPFVSGAVNLSFVVITVCALIAVGFGIYFFVRNMKTQKGSLIGLAAFVVMGIIAIAMADGANIGGLLKAEESTIYWSDAGLNFVYILGFVAIAAIIYSEVSKMLK